MPNSGEEEQDFDAQDFFITLKTVAKTSRVLLEVFDSLSLFITLFFFLFISPSS